MDAPKLTFDVDHLRFMAVRDQGFDSRRGWSYTRTCQNCGGVAAFIDYLQKVQDEHDNAWREDNVKK